MSEQTPNPQELPPLHQAEVDSWGEPKTKAYSDHAEFYAEERDKIADQLEDAKIDALTGMRNQSAFKNEYEKIYNRATPGKFAVMIIDITNLKPINDTYGHTTGDDLIALSAGSILRSLRPTDLVFRIGGDEFAVLMDGSNSEKSKPFDEDDSELDGNEENPEESLRDSSETIIGRLKINFAKDYNNSGIPKDVLTGIAIGMAVKDAYSSPKDTQDLADKRMYEDKAQFKKEHGQETR